ncbi:MAG TPA: SelB C-terminal domain-containing protein, partial [Candidatus Limnocylindrales bacterium]|nr:SelB C-terminal domain-containing protein [Candidatus Limnocylindrales bacterium]
ELQVHGGPVDFLAGGGRVALNLAAIEADDLPRGAVLTSDPQVRASPALIALVQPGHGGAAEPSRLAPGAALRLHLGTEQVQASIGRGRADLVALPDGRQVVRLRLARPIAVAAGDRFVLRRGGAPGAPGAVVGGRVLDPDPPIGPSRRRMTTELTAGLASVDPVEVARTLVGLHGVLDPDRLAHLPGVRVDDRQSAALGAVPLAGVLVAEPIAAALGAETLAAVRAATNASSVAAGLSLAELRTRLARLVRRAATVDEPRAGAIADALLAGLVTDGRLARSGDRIHEPGRSLERPADLSAAMDRLERGLATTTPPALREAIRASGCPPDGVRILEAEGRLIRLEPELAYAAATYRDLAQTALRMARSTALTPAAFRDATGTSRKYVMAILEDLDRRGILLRAAAGHLPGPRAASVESIGRQPG